MKCFGHFDGGMQGDVPLETVDSRVAKEKLAMTTKIIRYILYPVSVIGITVGLLSVAYAAVNSNIDPEAKWAWSTNAGWINFGPPSGGVTVCTDHLEGYAWGENIGWIRLGTHIGCDPHTYSNTSAADYGVNRDAFGNLSGYAWGTDVGWINFDPDGDEGVTIDWLTGDFSGYAWGENVGWINLNRSGPVSYKVSALFHRIYLPLVMKDTRP
jgi:hypothetical protein